MGVPKVSPVVIDKIRSAQLRLFRKHVRPSITHMGKGVQLKRHITRRVVEDGEQWNDRVCFDQPKLSLNKLKAVSLWDLFYYRYLQLWHFEANPLNDEGAFIKELHDLLLRLDTSTVRPNDFAFTFVRPRRGVVLELAKGKERFDSEKFPKEYRIDLKLTWVVKP